MDDPEDMPLSDAYGKAVKNVIERLHGDLDTANGLLRKCLKALQGTHSDLALEIRTHLKDPDA